MRSRITPALAAVLLALATALAYAGTLRCPFIFDDDNSITNNETIRSLNPLRGVLRPPAGSGETVGGRPLLNVSLAVNWAMSGQETWSYHLTNLLIHILAALALFALVLHTLGLTGAGEPGRRGPRACRRYR